MKSQAWWLAYWPVLLSPILMIPRLMEPQFGLLDDGLTLQITRAILTNGSLEVPFDLEAGRFRPIYWVYQTVLSLLADQIPLRFYIGNTLLLASAIVLIILLVQKIGGSHRQAWLTGLVFLLSGPVIENYYTLSKAEPLQAIFLLVSLILALEVVKLTSKWMKALIFVIAALSVLLACAIKETTLVLITISLAWLVIRLLQQKNIRQSILNSFETTYFLASLAGCFAFYVWRFGYLAAYVTGGSYTQKFQVGLLPILSTAFRWSDWLIRDYAFILPLFIFLWLFTRSKVMLAMEKTLVFSLIWMFGWLGIFLPWLYTAEYYLLPFSLGAAVFCGVILDLVWTSLSGEIRTLRKAAAVCIVASAILFSVTLAINYTNARIQLTSDKKNANMVHFLATELPFGSTVLVNYKLDHEYIQGIGLHLAEIYRRDDLKVLPFLPQEIDRRLGLDHELYLAETEVYNNIKLSTRLGIYESEAVSRNQEAEGLLSSRSALVYQELSQLRSLYIDLPRLFCLVANISRFCPIDSPTVDHRLFTYGWKVMKILGQ